MASRTIDLKWPWCDVAIKVNDASIRTRLRPELRSRGANRWLQGPSLARVRMRMIGERSAVNRHAASIMVSSSANHLARYTVREAEVDEQAFMSDHSAVIAELKR